MRGYSLVRQQDGYGINLTWNLDKNNIQEVQLWEGLPLLDEKIMIKILEVLDADEIRSKITQLDVDSENNLLASADALSDLVGKVVTHAVAAVTRFWYEEDGSGVRHYKGVNFFDKIEIGVLADAQAVPDGLQVEQDQDVVRPLINHVHEDLVKEGFVAESLIMLPAHDAGVLKFIYAIRVNDVYRFGLIKEGMVNFLFFDLPTTSAEIAGKMLCMFEVPQVQQKVIDVLTHGKDIHVMVEDLVRIAKTVPYERLLGVVGEDELIGQPIDPKTLLRSKKAVGVPSNAALQYFYAEPTKKGYSVGMEVTLTSGAEYLTLRRGLLDYYPETIQMIIDSLEVKARASIERILATFSDIEQLEQDVEHAVEGIVNEVQEQIERDSRVLRVEEFTQGVTIAAEQIEEVLEKSRRLILVKLKKDVPVYIVAATRTLDGDVAKAFPLTQLQGVPDENLLALFLKLAANKNWDDAFKKGEFSGVKRDFTLKIKDFVAADLSSGGRDNAQDYGGIDLNGKGMHLDVTKEGSGAQIGFNQGMVDQFKAGDFSGVVPVILKVTPIADPAAFLWVSL